MCGVCLSVGVCVCVCVSVSVVLCLCVCGANSLAFPFWKVKYDNCERFSTVFYNHAQSTKPQKKKKQATTTQRMQYEWLLRGKARAEEEATDLSFLANYRQRPFPPSGLKTTNCLLPVSRLQTEPKRYTASQLRDKIELFSEMLQR